MTIAALHTITSDFGERYFQLRQKEGRMYTDEETALLPGISKHHAYHAEWQLRKESCTKLVSYLKRKKNNLNILEVGCGNGWLCHQLSMIPASRVTGLDINTKELQQAKRVFDHIPGLQFHEGNIHSVLPKQPRYDAIILAASIQYFPSVPALITSLFQLLKYGGEIHILDSPFYKPAEIEPARERTAAHYNRMGCPEMSGYYFHHPETVLNGYDCRVLYRASFLTSFFPNNKNPFPWFCIKNK